MYSLVAESSFASRFIAASRRERESLRAIAQEIEEDLQLDARILKEREDVIFRQLVRQQSELEDVVRTLPLSEREPFRDELIEALIDLECIVFFKRLSNGLLQARCREKSAVQVLLSLCDVIKTNELLREEIGRFSAALECLDKLSEIVNGVDKVSCLVPNSRKTGGNFLWRVHFARLLVAGMLRRFGQPRYRLVADTVNALIDTPDPVTEGSVRDAWRRRVRSGRFAAVYSGSQNPG
jgi:hypothetical protein